MKRGIKRGLAPLVHALEQVGGTSPGVVITVFVFLALLQYTVDSLGNFLIYLFGEFVYYIFFPVAFILVVSGAMYLIRRHYRPRPVIEERIGLGAQTLLLFLSPPLGPSGSGGPSARSETEKAIAEAKQAARAISADPTKLQSLAKNRWRMPLESVAAHRSTLQRVILITSKETEEFVPDFRACVHAVDKALEGVEVISARKFAKFPTCPRFESDLERLLDLVDAVYAEIERRGEDTEKALTDVTGGTVLCSLAGLAATQPFRRRYFQYVSARPNEPASIRIWDVTFTLDQRPP